MWISIGAKRIDLSPRVRQKIEEFVFNLFRRERCQIASAVLSVKPAKLGGSELGFTCRIRLWSSYLGQVTVVDIGDTIRTAVQQASLRARHVVRRLLHKRRSQRRRFSADRLDRSMPALNVE
jgi:hypothetical protein